jgi:hypothetical protein
MKMKSNVVHKQVENEQKKQVIDMVTVSTAASRYDFKRDMQQDSIGLQAIGAPMLYDPS